MSSLQDVAKRAGVSATLVSRVINNQPGVSAKSRERILAAMAELNYVPNALARSLVKRSTQTIGIVMDTLCEPYFFPLIEGMEEAAASTAYSLVFSSARKKISVKKSAVRYYVEGRADGVLFYGSRLDDEEIISAMAEQPFPFVVVENTFPALTINNVSLDNAYGSEIAVDHLFARGCRRITHVGGDMRFQVSAERRKGFIRAMQRHGVTVDSSMMLQADFEVDSSMRIMEEYLARTPAASLPDAFYCGSDNTAYGCVMALEKRGIHVPDDILVVGFDDDLPPRGYDFCSLTTLSQPLRAMGKKAIEILLNSIKDPEAEKQQISFYPELIIRASSGGKE